MSLRNGMIAGICMMFVFCAGLGGQEPEEEADDRIQKAVRGLGAPTHTERENAVDRLLGIGAEAVPALARARGSDDPEIAFRAADVLEQLSLGITADTPREMRKWAQTVFESPNSPEAEMAARKLLDGGPQGWRVLKFLTWCHNIVAGGRDFFGEEFRRPGLDRPMSEEDLDRLLALTAIYIGLEDMDRHVDAFVSLCEMTESLERESAHALACYQLSGRPRIAFLLARLYWAAGRHEQARHWARRAVRPPPPDTDLADNTDAEMARNVEVVGLMLAMGDLEGAAAHYEQWAAALPEIGVEDTEEVEQVVFACRFGAAICRHLAGDGAGRDRNLDALEARIKGLTRDSDDDEGWAEPLRDQWFLGTVACGMAICQQSERAVKFALDNKLYHLAAAVRDLQGRHQEADKLLARGREVFGEEETTEGDEANLRQRIDEADSPHDLVDLASRTMWLDDKAATRRALSKTIELTDEANAYIARTVCWIADSLDAPELARQAVRKNVNLVKTETEVEEVGEIYGLAVAWEVENTEKLKKMLMTPRGPQFAPWHVAAAHAENGPADVWYRVLAAAEQDQGPQDIVDQAVRVADGKATPEEFRKVLGQVERALAEGVIDISYPRRRNNTPHQSTYALLADQCVEYGMPVRACKYAMEAQAAAEGTGLESRTRAAPWHLVEAGEWAHAADAFSAVHGFDDKPEFLYYQGWALRRAGREAKGRKLQEKALWLGHATGQDMTACVLECNTLEAGLAEWRRSWRVYPNRRTVGEPVPLVSEIVGDYSLARNRRCIAYLSDGDFRREAVRVSGYLNVNALLARLDAGEAVDVAAAVERFLTATEPDSEAAITLVRGLDRFGYNELAEPVYEATMERLRAQSEETPDWPSPRNLMAWVSAMCGRNLDEALDVAQGVVEEHPDAAYLDTLAHVYYARAEYRKAVETESRVLVEHHKTRWSSQPFVTFWALERARFRQKMQDAQPAAQ